MELSVGLPSITEPGKGLLPAGTGTVDTSVELEVTVVCELIGCVICGVVIMLVIVVLPVVELRVVIPVSHPVNKREQTIAKIIAVFSDNLSCIVPPSSEG
jgi:hypothetical protein